MELETNPPQDIRTVEFRRVGYKLSGNPNWTYSYRTERTTDVAVLRRTTDKPERHYLFSLPDLQSNGWEIDHSLSSIDHLTTGYFYVFDDKHGDDPYVPFCWTTKGALKADNATSDTNGQYIYHTDR